MGRTLFQVLSGLFSAEDTRVSPPALSGPDRCQGRTNLAALTRSEDLKLSEGVVRHAVLTYEIRSDPQHARCLVEGCRMARWPRRVTQSIG